MSASPDRSPPTVQVYDEIAASGDMVSADEAGLRQGIADGVPFPPSYVAFIRRFGYGLTCGRFLIYPPLGDFPDSISRLADPAEFKKVLPFAASPRPLTFCAAPSTHLQAWRQKRSSA